MSMIGNFRAVSSKALDALREDPSLVPIVLMANNEFLPSAGAQPVTLPANIRKYVEVLPEDQRALFLKNFAEQMAPFEDALADLYGTPEERSRTLCQAGITPEDCGAEISVDKAWDGLHFLLCGDSWTDEPPLSNVVMGGEEIGEDRGYGPARFLEPAEVRETAAALSAISETELEARFDPETMNAANIYPGNWEDEDNLSWLLEAFREVKKCYEDAAQNGHAMLMYVT